MPTGMCNYAKELYQTCFKQGKWPPSQLVQDAKCLPSGYGANVGEIGTPLTEAQILLLIQNNTNGGSGNKGAGKKGNCQVTRSLRNIVKREIVY